MGLRDFTSQRLYVDAPLHAGARIACTPEQANYLRNVLRMQPGHALLVFNGREGEWRGEIAEAGKRVVNLVIDEQTRVQENGPEITYLFAPLKRARLDFMVEKATEMGVARLVPVLTRHTIAERVNSERMRANAIEAAEQCGILRIPEIARPERLVQALSSLDARLPLIFCDEGAEVASPIATLSELAPGPVAVLIGPEGGFADEERAILLARQGTLRLSLGPRIMRADTAAIAVLALVNAVLGDWR